LPVNPANTGTSAGINGSILVDRFMRSTSFIVGALVVIGLGSALILMTPQPSHKRMVVTETATRTRPDGESVMSVPDPSEYPSQHTTPCDFTAYVPTRISDWLPRGITKRATPSYPVDARRRGVKGNVSVFILINRQGAVERVCSTGPTELRKAAEAAAVQFRFRRPTINEGIDPFGYIEETLVFNFLP
jgi:outer membrane biosynthesis protein TonB